MVKSVVESVTVLDLISPTILLFLNLIPYVTLWCLFTFLYVYMPNTKVRLSSAAVGGFLAGTIYQAFQWAYINFQILVSGYNAVYGSFAALPLFFIWVQLSWLIVLFGAEISFAHQNVTPMNSSRTAAGPVRGSKGYWPCAWSTTS